MADQGWEDETGRTAGTEADKADTLQQTAGAGFHGKPVLTCCAVS